MSTQTLAELADQAAEALRTISHRTRSRGDGLEYPSDVYDVVANIKTLVERMPQMYLQLGDFLTGELEAGRVGHDSKGSASAAVDQVRAALDSAMKTARTMADDLNTAHNALAHLTAVTK